MLSRFSSDPKSGGEMGSSMRFMISTSSALITPAMLRAEQLRKWSRHHFSLLKSGGEKNTMFWLKAESHWWVQSTAMLLCELNALAVLQMMSKILVMSHTDSLGPAHKVSGQYFIFSLGLIELQLFLPESNPSFALSKTSQRMSNNCIFQALWI